MGPSVDLAAIPQPMASRLARCGGGGGLEVVEGEGFRPAYRRDKTGLWTEVPLDAADATALHLGLRSVAEFSWRSREALRTIPANPWVDDDAADPPGSWAASDTAAALRARGLAPFRFLAIEPEATPERGHRVEFLTRHLAPLLEVDDARAWLIHLSSSGAVGSARAWEAPPPGPARDGEGPAAAPFVTVFGPLVQRLFDRLTAWYRPPRDGRAWTAWRSVFDFGFAIAAIAAVPVRSIFDAFYGTGAIEFVEPALAATVAAAEEVLSAPWVDRLDAVSPGLPEAYRELMRSALRGRSRGGCDLYAEVTTAAGRRHFIDAAGGSSSGYFAGASGSRKVLLPFARSIELSSKVDWGKVDPEVYWGHDVAWRRLLQASDLVNQSAFALIVNAGNNRWGGRHPPHVTHENGFDFDLDVAIPAVPGNVGAISSGKIRKDFRIMANLSVQQVPDKKGGFVDEQGNRFRMERVPGREGPVTLTLVDRLAFWVALQALHLVEMSDVLYADKANMDLALAHLVGQLSKLSPSRLSATSFKFLPKVGQPRQLLETAGHWNHLHAELPRDLKADLSTPPGFTGQRTWNDLYGVLLAAAEKRDKDPRFLELMFGPPLVSSEAQLYRAYWTGRGRAEPALLPVWEGAL